MRYKVLQPCLVRFTADVISCKFDNGVDCNTTIENIINQKLDPEIIPPIKVFNLKGIYYTCDNRRLYVFRAAQFMNALDFISVVVVSPCDFDLSILKPGRAGKMIRFENDLDTLSHWKNEWNCVSLVNHNIAALRGEKSQNTSIQQQGRHFEKNSDSNKLIQTSSSGYCREFFCCVCYEDDSDEYS